MATKAEVRQRVGENLGLVPIGQTLESQDQMRIDAAYVEVYEHLKEKGLATWASTGDVPTKLVPSFCLLIAQKLLISYSVPESRYLRINTDAGIDGTVALRLLAELSIQEYEPLSGATDY